VLEVADIFHHYGLAYLKHFGSSMLPSHRRAMADIMACRTRALGGYAAKCDHCDHIVYSYRSCGNRHCPKCFTKHTDQWLEKQNKHLLPVRYFHIVFTLPSELRQIVRQNQKILYDVLFRAAAQSLMELAADPRYVGGKIGILAVLHTWSRTMEFHPHVHFLVPGGAVSPDGCWLNSHPKFMVPRDALIKKFRGKFMDMARKALPTVRFPQSVWNKKWGVHLKATVQGKDNALRYLARYVHRVAIANSRIESIDNDQITFRYQNSKTGQWQTMPVKPFEFIRRFLQHVLPKGVVKIRYYGFLHQSNRPLLNRIKALFMLTGLLTPEPNVEETDKVNDTDMIDEVKPLCPSCKRGCLQFIELIFSLKAIPP
jgi:hypothetical protein